MLRTITSAHLRYTAGVAVILAAAAVSAQTSGQAQRGDRDVCCVNNFRYTGTCEVTVGAGESCNDVLSYLNNLNAVGRQYCGNTIIRGGWTLVPCDGSPGGAHASPGRVKASEPRTAPVTGAMQPIRPTTPETAPRGGATFLTPVEPSGAAKVSEVGLINL